MHISTLDPRNIIDNLIIPLDNSIIVPIVLWNNIISNLYMITHNTPNIILLITEDENVYYLEHNDIYSWMFNMSTVIRPMQ